MDWLSKAFEGLKLELKDSFGLNFLVTQITICSSLMKKLKDSVKEKEGDTNWLDIRVITNKNLPEHIVILKGAYDRMAILDLKTGLVHSDIKV